MEQRSLDELQDFKEGKFQIPNTDDVVKSIQLLLAVLDTVRKIGGNERARDVERGLLALRDVAIFAGNDLREIDEEIYEKLWFKDMM